MTTTAPATVGLPAAQPPALVVWVAHARDVSSAAREEYAGRLAALGTGPGWAVLRTCQRVELYVTGEALAELALPTPPYGTGRLDGADAARHLISVACGLESAVLGEDQVLHQVRQTHVTRRTEGDLDARLDRLFQVALRAGRQARDWMGGERRSLGDAALDRVEQQVGPLAGRQLLVVGAGSMGRMTAAAAARRGAQVLITNRTPARAAAVAGDVGGSAVPWPGRTEGVAGVVVAVSGPWPAPAESARLAPEGVPVVDLSSPSAVPGWLQAELDDLFLSVDDLAWDGQSQLREGLRDRLEALVAEAGRDYCRWLRTRDSLPAIQGVAEAVEQRRATEMAWLRRRLPQLSEAEFALVEQMSHRLVGGILHAPRTALNLDETGDLGRAARELFGV